MIPFTHSKFWDCLKSTFLCGSHSTCTKRERPQGAFDGMATQNITIPVITGPTAVGKTSVSIELAKQLKGEIISADSLQIYKYFDIGTAKPTKIELKKVKHHLIDVLSPEERFTAGDFYNYCKIKIPEIIKKEKKPIISGGTGLYLWTILNGISEIPKTKKEIREKVKKELKNHGIEFLKEKLKKIDPEIYNKIDLKNPVRITRAIEVFYQTGKKLSTLQKRTTPLPYEFKVFILTMPLKKLYKKISERTEKMLKKGWIDEVKFILKKYPNASGLGSIGYKEIKEYLENKINYSDMKNKIIKRTKEYARKQIIFWRRYKEAIWIDIEKENPLEKIKKYI